MEVQRRLRIGRRSLDGVREDEVKQGRKGERAGFAGAGKKNEEKDEGGQRGWGKKEKERERERALGIVSMTYVALTLSAKRL